MYTRFLPLPPAPKQSFFLWGPRQTGKTTLLKLLYPDALRIDLLKTDEMLRYLKQPSLLRSELKAVDQRRLVIIDEIQKVPALLDEIHFLIQEDQRVFGLCGSSARKVKRGHANLLGGRALRYEMQGLTAGEIGADFNLEHFLNFGSLPAHYKSAKPSLAVRSYVENYLKEEILAEGLVRQLPVFSDFLRVAAIGDTELVNLAHIARECGVSGTTAREHYNILVDTLMGSFLPAYTARPKRRVISAPKFYFHDLGVVNHLSRRGTIKSKSELYGKAFENWIFNELYIYSSYSEKFFDLSYWRLASGIEVDFILGNAEVAIEAKGKAHITAADIKSLLELQKDQPSLKKMIVVCCEAKKRILEQGITILPYSEFIKELWEGNII